MGPPARTQPGGLFVYLRVTIAERQPVFPAASFARTVMVLSPTSNGMVAVQFVVPVASPVVPVEAVHTTSVTATLSRDVPARRMLEAVVDTTVLEGEVMVSVGAVVSGPEVGGE